MFQVISEKSLKQRFYEEFERDFYTEIIVTIIPANLVRVTLYFKGMPNSIDLYKRIFLHVIPDHIIVHVVNLRLISLKKQILLKLFCVNMYTNKKLMRITIIFI